MKWPRLIGKPRSQPLQGHWQSWKKLIADHCDGCCIYCAIPEGRFGGIRNFHIEHFRPKVKYPQFENDISNLYLACSICNVLKCDDWPADPMPDHSAPGYPDPTMTDYNSLFSVNPHSYELESNTTAGKYLVERILLNRFQLILERRLDHTLRASQDILEWLTHTADIMTKSEERELVKLMYAMLQVQTKVITSRPYQDSDTKRVSVKKVSNRHSAL